MRNVSDAEKVSKVIFGVHDRGVRNIDHKFTVALMTERDVANLLSLSLATLRRWRLKGTGPAWLKIGATVRYRTSDVSDFLNGCVCPRCGIQEGTALGEANR